MILNNLQQNNSRYCFSYGAKVRHGRGGCLFTLCR